MNLFSPTTVISVVQNIINCTGCEHLNCVMCVLLAFAVFCREANRPVLRGLLLRFHSDKNWQTFLLYHCLFLLTLESGVFNYARFMTPF